MRTKNLTIKIREGEKIPYQETYVALFKSKNKINIHKKFIDQTKNQFISLNFRECRKLIELLSDYVSKQLYINDENNHSFD